MAHTVKLATHVWGNSNKVKETDESFTEASKFNEKLMSEAENKIVDQYHFFDTQIAFSFFSDSWFKPGTLQFNKDLLPRIRDLYIKPFDELLQNTAHLIYFAMNNWADIPTEIKSDLILRFIFNVLNPFYWLRYLISNIKISLLALDTLLFGGMNTTRNCKSSGSISRIPQNKFTRIFWSNDAHIIRKILSFVFRPLLRGIMFILDLISFALYFLGKIQELLTYIPARLTLAFLYNYNPNGHILNFILALIAGFIIPAAIVAATLLTAGVGVVGPVILTALTTMAAKFTAAVATVSAFLGGLTYTYLALACVFWITGVTASYGLGIIKSTPNFLKEVSSFLADVIKNMIQPTHASAAASSAPPTSSPRGSVHNTPAASPSSSGHNTPTAASPSGSGPNIPPGSHSGSGHNTPTAASPSGSGPNIPPDSPSGSGPNTPADSPSGSGLNIPPGSHSGFVYDSDNDSISGSLSALLHIEDMGSSTGSMGGYRDSFHNGLPPGDFSQQSENPAIT